MKKTILIISILLLIIISVFLNNSKTNPTQDKEKTDVFKFTTNIGFSESKISTHPISILKEHELSNLFGTPVTNTLGIPDVYLNIIDNNIPESNINARLSSVKMFYYNSLALRSLKEKNYNSFLKNTFKWSAGMSCFFFYEKNDNVRNQLFVAEKNIDKNNINLKKLNQQADNNLGGHVFYEDYGLEYINNNYIEENSKYSESELCEKYLKINL